jgi:hypothetical protein
VSSAARSPRWWRSIAGGAALFAVATTAAACGLEDPSSISARRGILNIAFPESLHVGTAVWQAQLAGALPRDALAQQGDLAPEARTTLRLLKANALLHQLAAKLAEGPGSPARPKLAIVLLGPVLWSRFETDEGRVRATVHVAGPESGDVVVVTDAPVVEAMTRGELDFAGALRNRVVRLYGEAPAVAEARRWLTAEH